jgi:protoporphyrinogen oxidase
MQKVRYLVLGAGPSGLTVALALIDRGVARDDILVLEKQEVAGGLCRSEQVDGAPLDIGGGHFLDVRKRNVLDFLFRYMPEEEWDAYSRISRIHLRDQSIDYPLEANLWQLGVDDQIEFLDSIAHAGCVGGAPAPASFEEWVTWKLGVRIAEDYMLPYNRKIWSTGLDTLGTYWLHKLPDVSFRDTLRSCLECRPAGSIPAHGRFLYPKRHGYGEVWRRMGAALAGSLVTRCPVESIDVQSRTVNGRWSAETIISTIPWTLWPDRCQMPDETLAAIGRLRNVSIDVDYVAETLRDPSHWIYEPDERVAHHRLLLRSNFAQGSRGHWTETNSARSRPGAGWRHRNEFAYPLNTRDKPQAVSQILSWASRHRILGIGRWGTWDHMNSDVAVDEALKAADRLCDGKAPAR